MSYVFKPPKNSPEYSPEKSQETATGSEDPTTVSGSVATLVDTDPAAVHQKPREEPSLIWLQPTEHRFQRGGHGQLELWQGEERLGSGVFILRTFPASHPNEYLSVRGWNAEGDEIELGMIRDLTTWTTDDQIEITEALGRRYLMREITAIHSLSLKFGFLDFEVQTASGRSKFSMRWTQSQAIDYGENGKLIIDTEENRYLVRDIELLSATDQEKFSQYVYW